ncbi:protein IQ-DOMAIN 1 [Quillaja saponaria]|uniref:Protein IQ-DOMAIN 1 n=1 Tax=Quillaja saponaria TaxID=32244 RepID=A0AAD7VIJ0_QUISA|nr:protein IQ-DOMAIN 1 [Quillaja saponaria]
MGGKGNWFSSVKKALSPDSKEKNQKSNKSKKKWFGKQKYQASESYLEPDRAPPPIPQPEEIKLTDDVKENSHVYSVTVAPSVEAVESVSAATAAEEVVRPAISTQFAGKSKEEVAAIMIQTAFRGHLGRRALRALRGLVRLKSLMEGPVVKRQATSTLRSMQTLARKHAKEIECMRLGEEWDDSLQSKEQIEAKLLSKYEAAMRRERAMAYSFTHQQTMKNSSRSLNPMFMDPTNPGWGWSWLERWMAARPLEGHSTMEKELNNDQLSVKSVSHGVTGGEINRSYVRYQLNSDKHSPTASEKPTSPSFQSHSTPSKPASKTAAKKLKSASPRSSWGLEDDSKSMVSVQSDRFRRHSIAGSSVRDDESLASSPALPSYMVATQSAKAKSRIPSPLAMENGTTEKGSSGTVKKRLSFPASPARPRRHSGPPRVERSLNSEISVSNGVAG